MTNVTTTEIIDAIKDIAGRDRTSDQILNNPTSEEYRHVIAAADEAITGKGDHTKGDMIMRWRDHEITVHLDNDIFDFTSRYDW